MRYSISVALIAVTLTSCAAPRTAPIVAPAPMVTPAPRPSPAVPPLASDWNDWPFSPGDWAYRRDGAGSIALFGPVGGDAMMTLRCDRARAMLYLSVRGTPGGATVRTTTLNRSIALQPTGGDAEYAASALATSDVLLDAMAFSRGRFVIEHAGQPPLVLPPYAEIGRVIEDCRG